jgi:excisionase family DNA binding protein
MGTVTSITAARNRTPISFRQLLTPAEVAAIFNVHPKSVTRSAKQGKLPSVRTVGGHRRYFEDDVRAFLQAVRHD